MTIPNENLADEIIERLNQLIVDPAIRKDIGTLLETRIPCSPAVLDHPTLQGGWATQESYDRKDPPGLGILGLINGLVGTIADGPRRGWGFITATFDDDMQLVSFSRTEEPKSPPAP